MAKERSPVGIIDNWFEVDDRHGNGVTSISEPYHDEEVFCYLAKGSDADLLVDTGMGIGRIKQVLDIHHPKSKKLIVVNTHAHFDHIGGNAAFVEVLTPANEWERQNILNGWDHGYMTKEGVLAGFTDKLPSGFDREAYAIPSYAPIDPVLTDNFRLDLGNRVFTVLSTPGHTPGSICLFEERTGLFFTSDLLYQGPLYCFAKESSLPDYYASLKRVLGIKRNIVTIHPGHNYSHASPRLVECALECFERALDHQPPDSSNLEYREYRHPSMPRLAIRICPTP